MDYDMLGLVRHLEEYVAPVVLILGALFRHLSGLYVNIFFHVRRVPCHHAMACPQVADGGDVLQF
jgi:hypothetical protein